MIYPKHISVTKAPEDVKIIKQDFKANVDDFRTSKMKQLKNLLKY